MAKFERELLLHTFVSMEGDYRGRRVVRRELDRRHFIY
jgi:hypothetical protein